MEIFIQHQGQQTGPFTQQEILAGLARGTYQQSDLIWYEGAPGWLPLSAAPHISGGATHIPTVAPAGSMPQSSGLAVTSMILGISSFFCGITSIPAVVCGHLALGKIKRSQGTLSGGGFAIAGLVTGYLGILVFIALLAGLTAPLVIRQRKMAGQTEAVNNARSFSLALYEFEAEYGSFPNAATAALVAKDSGMPEITGNSSNARFRQLFHADITQSEQMFYAKSADTRKPDGDISDNELLAPGECGFGYFENIRTDDGKARPIAMTPFVPGTEKFDPLPFNGKAIVLFSDSSVQILPIDRITGEAALGGQNILNPTHHIWGGTAPILLLPE